MICSWKDQKNRFSELIKSLSDHYGGEREDDLNEYIRDILETNKEGLGKAILYFEELSLRLKIKPYQSHENSVRMDLCEKCGYIPPFCRCS